MCAPFTFIDWKQQGSWMCWLPLSQRTWFIALPRWRLWLRWVSFDDQENLETSSQLCVGKSRKLGGARMLCRAPVLAWRWWSSARRQFHYSFFVLQPSRFRTEEDALLFQVNVQESWISGAIKLVLSLSHDREKFSWECALLVCLWTRVSGDAASVGVVTGRLSSRSCGGSTWLVVAASVAGLAFPLSGTFNLPRFSNFLREGSH